GRPECSHATMIFENFALDQDKVFRVYGRSPICPTAHSMYLIQRHFGSNPLHAILNASPALFRQNQYLVPDQTIQPQYRNFVQKRWGGGSRPASGNRRHSERGWSNAARASLRRLKLLSDVLRSSAIFSPVRERERERHDRPYRPLRADSPFAR